MAPIRVLFVCMGNICRSPAAEIIFRERVAEQHMQDRFEIDSAGTISYHQGSPPDTRMAKTLRDRGYSITGKARQIQVADLARFDHIMTMDESNREDVQKLDPTGAYQGKIQPIVRFARSHQDAYVPDPYYGGSAGFEHVANLLEDACAGLLEKLIQDLRG